MIFKITFRKFCNLCSNEIKFKQNFKSIHDLFKNSKVIKNFNDLIKIQEIEILSDLFKSNGFELRLAGGVVRDLLSGIEAKDIDLASNATPVQINQIIRNKPNVWTIKTSSGQKHGTVTARVNDRVQYEIHSLHKWSDERPGQLLFVKDWKIDAMSRDFTINAMYLGFDGILYDYFDGLKDLNNKVVRFVGRPEDPIIQNIITIFRYFRFHCRFNVDSRHDSHIVSIIKRHCIALRQTNGQKIWFEMKKIFVLKECFHSIDVMFNEIQIGRYLGFNEKTISLSDNRLYDLIEFRSVLSNLTNGVNTGLIAGWEASTLLAALIEDEDQLSTVSKRLCLSKCEQKSIRYIIQNRKTFHNLDLNQLQIQLVLTPKDQQNDLLLCITECMKYCGLFSSIESMAESTKHDFPFTGHLFTKRVQNRRSLNLVINELKIFWFNNHFKCTEEELSSELDRILQNNDLSKRSET